MTREWDVTFKTFDGGHVTICEIKSADIRNAPRKAKKAYDEDMVKCFRLRDCVEIRQAKYGEYADARQHKETGTTTDNTGGAK